jgi:hypothetical protein
MKRFAIAFALAVSLASAQTPAANSGPALGFVPGRTPWQLQPILGIPGAARLGDPIALSQSVTQIYLAPGQTYAAAAQGPTDPLALVTLLVAGVIQLNPVLAPLPGALANPDLVAFSPAGQSMALFSQAAGRVQVFTGLPGSPQKSQDVSNVAVAALLAVSDDAQAVLISDGLGNAYSLAQNAAPIPVYHTAEISALAFVPQSHAVILCDPIFGTAAVAQAVDGIQILPQPAAACQPRAAAGTADGKTILLACPAQHLIWSIDRASGSIDVHPVSNSPAAFNSLALPNTFVMSPADDAGTYWLITWQAGAPVTSFIGASSPRLQRLQQ